MKKGYKQTKEHTEKIAEANRGQKRSKETKERLRLSHLGNKQTEKTKKKIKENSIKAWNAPERKEMASEGSKRKWKDPVYRQNVLRALPRGKNHYMYINGHTEEARKRMSEAQKGEKHRLYGKHRSGETCRKISESNKGRKVSQDTRRKISEAQKGKKHSNETRKKIGEITKMNFLDPKYLEKYRKGMNVKPNKPEKTLASLLNKILPSEYKYVGDYSFWINGKNPDFMSINGEKKLIEVFGDYWHYSKPRKKNPELTKKAVEKERISHFKKYSFNTLIIWESELKNPEKLIKKILEFNSGSDCYKKL